MRCGGDRACAVFYQGGSDALQICIDHWGDERVTEFVGDCLEKAVKVVVESRCEAAGTRPVAGGGALLGCFPAALHGTGPTASAFSGSLPGWCARPLQTAVPSLFPRCGSS